MILALEITLAFAFFLVAAWLDRTNRRVNAENESLRSTVDALTGELGRVRDERDEEVRKNYELTLELEAYRDERETVSAARSALH